MFVRTHGVGPGEQVIIVHHGPQGPVEIARHQRARPGSPQIIDAHFPDHTAKTPGDYTIVPRSKAEAEFLRIGHGAQAWLLEAAAAGTARMNVKMAEAVTLAKIAGITEVDQALGTAAIHGRFATGDLASILKAATARQVTHAAGESKSLTQGTSGWAAISQPPAAAAETLGESA